MDILSVEGVLLDNRPFTDRGGIILELSRRHPSFLIDGFVIGFYAPSKGERVEAKHFVSVQEMELGRVDINRIAYRMSRDLQQYIEQREE